MGKKIAVLLNSEPEWGGQHQYALTLMECAAKSDSNVEFVGICENQYWKRWCRGHKISSLHISWPSLTEKTQKFHIKHRVFSRIYTMYMTGLGRELRSQKIDAVLCTTQGVFIPNIGRKVIVPVHDLMHRYEGRFPEVRKDYETRELSFYSKAKYAWCILTDSMVGKRQFIESYSKYMRKTCPRIVSLPYIVPQNMIKCEEEFVEIPSKYIFYPAQFWEHKNHMNLVRAIDLLIQDIPDIHLLLVGSEKNNMGKVKKYISKHGLSDHVTVKGFVSDGNIKYLYKHAVGMVMPSYFGPTNIPPLEAMALGCPVAVSDKYAMSEQVGDAGLLFDPDSSEEIAECIKKIWLNEDLRQEMIEKGYRRMEKWTLKSFKRKFEKVIEKV